MLLDREMQLEILQELSDIYPNSMDLSKKYPKGSEFAAKYVANLAYLQDHGLISHRSVLVSDTHGDYSSQASAGAITHRGIDFLADDGGLSAILGVVTIKFETEQFRSLIESLVLASNLPSDQKQSMIDAIKELPAESVKHIAGRLMDSSWDNFDSLMSMIQNFIM